MAYPHGIARPSEQLWAGEATTTSIPPDQRRRRISPMTNDTTKAAPDERAELKPCPFCGDAMEWRAGDYAAHTSQVDNPCPIALHGFTDSDKWNTRTPPQVKVGALERIIWSAMVWARENPGPDEIPEYTDGGNSYAENEARVAARRILEALA